MQSPVLYTLRINLPRVVSTAQSIIYPHVMTSQAPPSAPAKKPTPIPHTLFGTLHLSAPLVDAATVFVPTILSHWLKPSMVAEKVCTGGAWVGAKLGVNVSWMTVVTPLTSVVVYSYVVGRGPVAVGAGAPTGPCC